ncbi:uncharacterized protein TNCV_938911 [Trichonephila clavipes]|nr:uncharacterized protein TNCV_938911 [Trichonephila clavipes]
MQKKSVIHLPEMRPFTTNGFLKRRLREHFQNLQRGFVVVVATYSTLSTVTADQGPRYSSWLRARFFMPVASLSFENHAGEYDFSRFHSNFNGELPGSYQRPPTSPSLSPNSREDLWLDGYLEYQYIAKALYIYKHPFLLWDSNPGPTAPQAESLTTIPDWWHWCFN